MRAKFRKGRVESRWTRVLGKSCLLDRRDRGDPCHRFPIGDEQTRYRSYGLASCRRRKGSLDGKLCPFDAHFVRDDESSP
jgi:hypothetical protein